MLRALQPEDTERICLFGAEVFCKHEPMCKALGTAVPDFVQQFTPIIHACCSSGLSFVLEEAGGAGEPLSMSLALPYAQYSAIKLDDHPAFRPVLAVFDALDAQASDDLSADVMCFMWATRSDQMNKGYNKIVAGATVEAARRAGSTGLVADFTNVVSQHMMGYFGYKPAVQVRYHDFECFKSIQCTQYVFRAVKPLAADQQEKQQQGKEQLSSCAGIGTIASMAGATDISNTSAADQHELQQHKTAPTVMAAAGL